MNYTKGEWKVSEFSAGELRVCNEYENICYLVTMPVEGQELANAHLIAAAPEMAESGTELDTAIGQAIIKIAQATKLSNALIQIIQETVLPAQEKWRKALAKAEGGTK